VRECVEHAHERVRLYWWYECHGGMWLSALLVIDDEEAFLELFVEFMGIRHPDVEVHCAKDGNEGIGLYKKLIDDKKELSLVVVDYHLKGLGGVDTISEIKNIDSGQRVVVLTANRTPAQVDDAKKVGAEVVIEKPYDFSEMVDHPTKIMQVQ